MSQADELAGRGFFVIEALLGRETCAELLAEILGALRRGVHSYVHEGVFRLHCPLALNNRTHRAIRQLLEPTQVTIAGFLRRQQFLAELSSITVFPFARAQPLHADEADRDRQILTIFANLTPTARGVGALRVVPGSHRGAEFGGEPTLLELPAGSAVFMDGKLRHGGGENASVDRVRPVFYVSFGDTDIAGPVYSLRPEYRQRYRLDSFVTRPIDGATRPGFASDQALALAPAGASERRRLLILRHGAVDCALDLPDDRSWVFELVELILGGDQPVRTLAERLGVSQDDVITVLEDLAALGLVTWPAGHHGGDDE